MQFTLFQVIGLIVAVIIALWAIKRLIAHYLVKILMRKRYCVSCLNNATVNTNAPWKLHSEDGVPLFLCESCKSLEFPGEVGAFAETHGYLKKVQDDNANK